MMSLLANHLWQSTLFAIGAVLLTLFFRKNGAHVRYWVWFAASVKFLIPFSLLVALGGQLHWRAEPSRESAAHAAAAQLTDFVGKIAQPVVESAESNEPVSSTKNDNTSRIDAPAILTILWVA